MGWQDDPIVEETPKAAPIRPPLAQRAISAISAKPGEYGIPRGLTQFAASMPIPALTTAAGAVAGGLLAPATGGVVNPVTGGMLGGGAGEALNQKLGITEPSDLAVGASMAAPVVGRYAAPALQAAKRGLSRILPGTGQPLQERAATMAPGISKIGAPEKSAEKLYDEVAKHNPMIDVNPYRERLVAMQGEILRRSKWGPSPGDKALLNELEGKINALAESPTGTIPFGDLRAIQKDINARIGNAHGEDLGMLKQLAKGIKESYEQAATSRFAAKGTPEAVATLKAANAAFVKERGAAELDKAFSKSMIEHEGGVKTFSDTARKNIKKILNANEEIKQAYKPEEIAEMKQALDAIGPLPGLPPSPETLFGGLRYSAPAVVGSLVAPAVGAHPLMGATAGMSLDLALRKVVASEWGRQKVIAYATSTGKQASPEIVMSIAAALTGGVSGAMRPAQGTPIQPPTGLPRAFAIQQ